MSRWPPLSLERGAARALLAGGRAEGGGGGAPYDYLWAWLMPLHSMAGREGRGDSVRMPSPSSTLRAPARLRLLPRSLAAVGTHGLAR